MRVGMISRPSPGRALASWLSLGALAGVYAVFCLLWGGLLLAFFHPAVVPWTHLDALPRTVQDAYTVGIYLALPVFLYGFWKPWEGRKWSELAGGFSGRSFVTGLTLGTLGLVFIYGSATLLGWVSFRMPSPWPWRATMQDAAAGITIGGLEELVFRGMVLRTLLRDSRPTRAIAGSAVLYALAHFVRPGMTLESSLLPFLGLGATGTLFAYAAWSRRTLWLSVGMHAVWVFFIALSSQYNLWSYAPSGVRWTGNGYPPSGAGALVVMLACFGWLWVRRPSDALE